MFMGAFLGYFFGLLNQARLQRQATYYEVMRFVAEYREFTTEHERPDAKFRASYFWVNIKFMIHSRRADLIPYGAKVEKLVTFDAKLPSGVTQTEYDAKRDQSARCDAGRVAHMRVAEGRVIFEGGSSNVKKQKTIMTLDKYVDYLRDEIMRLQRIQVDLQKRVERLERTARQAH